MNGAITRFVTERPHDDARVIAVAADHAGDARHDRVGVTRVVTQAGVPTVALDVRLVHYVEAQFIAQVEKPRVVGIVRTAHRVHVVLLHQHDVGTHVVNRHGLAALGMMVVPVDTTDHDPPTVDEEVAVDDLDPSEARSLLHALDNATTRIDQLCCYVVERRGFGRPCIHAGNFEVNHRRMPREQVGSHIGCHCRRGFLPFLPRRIAQLHPHRPSRGRG